MDNVISTWIGKLGCIHVTSLQMRDNYCKFCFYTCLQNVSYFASRSEFYKVVNALKVKFLLELSCHYINRCASMIAWFYLAGRSPEQLVIDLFAQHQLFAVCCLLVIPIRIHQNSQFLETLNEDVENCQSKIDF